MKENALRPGPLALALLVLVLAFTAEIVLATLAEAGPYPRHDHYGISEDQRQYPHRRKDDYEDYRKRRQFRRDQYQDYVKPTLSEMDPTPEGSISLERVETMRSQYLLYRDYNLKSHEGQGWYDKPGNQSYGLEYNFDWKGPE